MVGKPHFTTEAFAIIKLRMCSEPLVVIAFIEVLVWRSNYCESSKVVELIFDADASLNSHIRELEGAPFFACF